MPAFLHAPERHRCFAPFKKFERRSFDRSKLDRVRKRLLFQEFDGGVGRKELQESQIAVMGCRLLALQFAKKVLFSASPDASELFQKELSKEVGYEDVLSWQTRDEGSRARQTETCKTNFYFDCGWHCEHELDKIITSYAIVNFDSIMCDTLFWRNYCTDGNSLRGFCDECKELASQPDM